MRPVIRSDGGSSGNQGTGADTAGGNLAGSSGSSENAQGGAGVQGGSDVEGNSGAAGIWIPSAGAESLGGVTLLGGSGSETGTANSSAGGVNNSTGGAIISAGGVDIPAPAGTNHSTGGGDITTAGGANNSTEGRNTAAAGTDYSTGGVDSSTGGVDHSTGGVDHSTGGVDHSTGGVDHSTGGVDHSTGGVDHSTGGVDDSTGGVDDSTGGVDYSAGGVDDSTGGVDHSTGGVDHSTGGVVMTPERRYFDVTHPWPDPRLSICYEIVGQESMDPSEIERRRAFVQTVRSAIEGSWERVADIDFDLWQDCGSTDAAIRLLIDPVVESVPVLGFPGWYIPLELPLASSASEAEILNQFGRALGFENEYGIEQLPGPCIRCNSSATCIGDRNTCLPSGFCGRLSDHESIMAPPDCGGIESIRRFSPWDIAGAVRAYNPKPTGSVVSFLADCVQIKDSGRAQVGSCLGFDHESLEYRQARGPEEVDQFVSMYLPDDNCLQLDEFSETSGVSCAACVAGSPAQDFRMDEFQLRGLGDLCVVAPAATAGLQLTTANCGRAAEELKWWRFRDGELALAGTNLCASIAGGIANVGTQVILAPCGSAPESQVFGFRAGRIQIDNHCFDVSGGLPIAGSGIILWNSCALELENDDFYVSGPIRTTATGGCLTVDPLTQDLSSTPCAQSPTQQWDYHP